MISGGKRNNFLIYFRELYKLSFVLLFMSFVLCRFPLCYLHISSKFLFQISQQFHLTCNNILPFSIENVCWQNWYLLAEKIFFLQVHIKGLSNVTTLSIYSPMV